MLSARSESLARLAPLLILLCILGAHGASLWNRFSGDDNVTITDHPAIGGGQGALSVFLYDAAGQKLGVSASIYRPVTGLTYYIDWHLGGHSPIPFHVTNLVLYAALCLVGYRFAQRFVSVPLALSASCLFAALPLHVEAVGNATGRSEILSLLFGLLSLRVACPQEPEQSDSEPESHLVQAKRAALALFLYTLSIFSKESSFLYPLVAAWLVYTRGSRSVKGNALGPYVPALAMGLGSLSFLLVRRGFLLSSAEQMARGFAPDLPLFNPLHDPSLGVFVRLWTSLDILGRYLLMTVWPRTIQIDHSFAEGVLTRRLGASPLALLGLLVALGLAFFSLRSLVLPRHRRKALGALCGAFIGAYLPIANLLVPIGAFAGSRLFFGGSYWLLLIGVLLLGRIGHLVEHPGRLYGLVLAALVPLCFFSVEKNRCWVDVDTRIECALVDSPASYNALGWGAARYERLGSPFRALWYSALRIAVAESFPRRFVPPQVVHLSYEERVADMMTLLHPQDRVAFLTHLERFLVKELRSPRLLWVLKVTQIGRMSPPLTQVAQKD